MRVGHGFDAHRFDPSRPLVLGGVAVDDHPGLSGPSDGDAVAHAVIDALMGAAGLGGIGDLRDDDGPARADSLDLLATAVREAEGKNYQVVNGDVTVVTTSPAVASATPRMEQALAERLHVGPDHVSVTARDVDGMGWIGDGEGIAVMAVVLVDRPDEPDLLHASLRSGG